ncbi:MAG TPA: PBP1A family penicillin-binding protein [Verrucomicrobiae bacterium]|jgi:penicillin-binding protein 1A|nr:PBP1A family penicillin-binding protein [Verrucomicrobiae bacterium]
MLRFFVYTIGLTIFLAALAVGGIIYYYGHDLPDRLDLKSGYQPAVVSTVYDIEEKPVGEFYLQRRFVVPLDRIPRHVIQALLAAEDSRFYAHGGIDLVAIVRASFANIRKRKVHEGASTLTQQLVRGFFLTPKRTFDRKIREAILAYRVEKNHTKDEILYLYFNQVYFGHGNYGIEAASRDYFGKTVSDINVAEAALLAGLPRSPSRNSPYRDFFAARERQRYVLGRMLSEGFVTRATYEDALQTPLHLNPAPALNSQIAPHFVEHVRRVIGDRYGFNPLLQGGLRIYTTLDSSLQAAAQRAVHEGIDEIRLRLRKKARATRPERDGDVEGALLAMEPGTGMVRALVGGYDFANSQYNRALQAKRQPGSSFKPIIYSAALESGLSELSVVQDGPLSFRLAAGKVWRPQNYDGKFHGPVTLRSALAHSLNSVSVRLVQRVGVERTIQQARKLGIESALEKNLSLALGTPSVTLLEMVRAFGVFAAGGNLAEPLFILKVTDRDGKVLEENEPVAKQVLPPEIAYVMTDMLKNVVQSGTARAAAKLGKNIAGKTGTTSDFRDGWFIGYDPNIVAGVWVGYDDHRSIADKETGASLALPIWLSFMTEAREENDDEDFPVPEGINWMDVNLRERYPLPVFESSPIARIPYVSTARTPSPVPAKEASDKSSNSPKVEPADLTGISAEGQPARTAW